MGEQLFDPGPPAEATLTPRQQRVLAMVRTTPGGPTAALVGAAEHRVTWALGGRECSCCAPGGAPCDYSDETGRAVLARLRELGYGLVRRRTGRWEVPGTTPLEQQPEGLGQEVPY